MAKYGRKRRQVQVTMMVDEVTARKIRGARALSSTGDEAVFELIDQIDDASHQKPHKFWATVTDVAEES